MYFSLLFLFACISLNATENPHPTQGEWSDYYQNTLHATVPWKTLLVALQSFENEGKASEGSAVDLGTGTGKETLFLLKKGWKVLAIDGEPQAIEILSRRVDEYHKPQLQTSVCAFSHAVLPPDLDLINAGYSLPFCSPENFALCWNIIRDHLAIGGRFAGQLFGNKGEEAANPLYTTHTQEEVEFLFKENFVIEYIENEESRKKTATGRIRDWHVFHLVARKVR
jgi:SAM-dependent methyltransferase